AVTLARAVQLHVQRVGRQAGADHQFEPVRAPVEQADREVVEVHQVAREADDLVLQQLQPLGDVQLRQRLALEPHELAAGLVDRVDLLLEPAGAGRVPHDRDDLHDLPRRVDHRRADHLHELLVLDVQRV
ncbi:MAG: hypothetical protein AVDCRST_MAG64-3620, partial [uncultured Phycisphaerae bacterium]